MNRSIPFLSILIFLAILAKIGNTQVINQKYVNKLNAFIPDFLVNEDTGHGSQNHSSVALDDSGNFVIVWEEKRNGANNDMYAQRFLKDGTPVGSDFKVNDGGLESEQNNPEISMDGIGNFVIVWQSGGKIFIQRYLYDGTKAGKNLIVNEFSGNHPQVAVDSSGVFIVIWRDYRNSNTEPDIYGQAYSEDGIAINNNFKINDDEGIANPDLAANSKGEFIAVWQYLGDGGLYIQKLSREGNLNGPNINIKITGVFRFPRIAMDNNGDFIVAWTDSYDLYARRFFRDGSPLKRDFKVNTQKNSSFSPQYAISIDNYGRFVIVWMVKANIYGQAYNKYGVGILGNFKINQDEGNATQSQPAIPQKNFGSFIVSWTDYRNIQDIYVQQFSNDVFVQALGDNFNVNKNQGTLSQNKPEIAVDGSGNFIITWLDYRLDKNFDIYLQRFTETGSPLDGAFLVTDNSTNVISPQGHDVAMDKKGNFVITWQHEEDGRNEIYARFFTFDGALNKTYFKVNDDIGDYNHWQSVVNFFPDGRFVIVWTDTREGHQEIYGQIYDSKALPIGDNFKISNIDSTNLLNQISSLQLNNCGNISIVGSDQPAMAINEDGDFVVVWRDYRHAYYDFCTLVNIVIYARVFSNEAVPLGNEIQITNASNDNHLNPSVTFKDSIIIVSWFNKSGWGVVLQRFNKEGISLEDSIRFIEEKPNFDSYRSLPLSTNDAGDFVIAWATRNNDVYAQRFSSQGILIGGNFRITNTSTGYQDYPDIVLFNNKIYNTWIDNRAGESGFDIWANILDWDIPVTVRDKHLNQAGSYSLDQNYPNPFNPTTVISYLLSTVSDVELKIYNQLGQEVRTMVHERKPVGAHQIEWDGRDHAGNQVASGVYLYRLKAGSFVQSRKMVFLR